MSYDAAVCVGASQTARCYLRFGMEIHMKKGKLAGGAWVTMVTPFRNGKIDYPATEKLVEWYVKNGVDGIFAVCQSSEMFYLDLEEREQLGRFVVEKAAGRVPVVVSGHISEKEEDQIEEISRMAKTGADAVVLVTNRLALEEEGDDILKKRLERLLETVPECVFGLYECPYPYKRLLTPELLQFCASTGRIRFLKDTCCDEEQIRKKLEAIAGTDFQLFNANTATLLQSLKDGAAGYCGVMANYHPGLYHWLVRNKEEAQADAVQAFATVCSWVERRQYPRNAKYHLRLCGVDMTLECRKPFADEWGRLDETEIQALYRINRELNEREKRQE